ncbi:MAG: TraB/GumN family protein [Caulobacteraceae bacterium]
MSGLPKVRAIGSWRAPWAAALAALACSVASASAQPPVWIAHGPHSTLVLFGSVHLLPVGLDWEPPVLVRALAKAGEVWFELPIDAATDAEAARLARARGALPPGESLAADLTADQSARLTRVVASLGAAPQAIDGMRPWLAEITLSLTADERAGAVASLGVEQQIQQCAPPTARRRALETAGQQIDFLADAATADQVASLDESLHEIEERPGSYRQVVAEWMSGDLPALDGDALAPLRKASPALYARLITQRNQRWAEAMAGRLARPGVTVAIVGVGHLIGPGGVPALLRARGVRVEGP